MDELDLRIRNHLYSSFVRDGTPASAVASAAALDLDEAAVAASYRRLHEAHALVLEPAGEHIRMLNPFSVVPTPHRVSAGGRRWFANCAWDALGILAALQHTAGRIQSICPDCGDRIELEIDHGKVVRGEELIVHFVVPARRWWDDIVFT